MDDTHLTIFFLRHLMNTAMFNVSISRGSYILWGFTHHEGIFIVDRKPALIGTICMITEKVTGKQGGIVAVVMYWNYLHRALATWPGRPTTTEDSKLVLYRTSIIIIIFNGVSFSQSRF